MFGLRQHPPKRPSGFEVPAVDGIVREHTAADEPACEAALVEPWVVPLAFEAAVRVVLEDEPPPLVEAAVPAADPEEITDVGTLNGSKPQLGAPRMNSDAPDVEQNLIPPELPPLAPDWFALRSGDENGLDKVGGAAATAAPGPASSCGGLT